MVNVIKNNTYVWIRSRTFSKAETNAVQFSKFSIASKVEFSSRFKNDFTLGDKSSQVFEISWMIRISWKVSFTFPIKWENAGVLGAYTSFPLKNIKVYAMLS